MNSKKFERALSMRTPNCTTALGRRGAARLMRFCNSTWARSMLVPASKVAVIEPEPLACEIDSM